MSNFSFLKTEDVMSEILKHNMNRFGPFLKFAENIFMGSS